MVKIDKTINTGVIGSNLMLSFEPSFLENGFVNISISSIFLIQNNDATEFGIKKGNVIFVTKAIQIKGGMLIMIKKDDKFLVRQLLNYNGKFLVTTGKEKDKPKNLEDYELIGIISWCCSAKIDYNK